MGDYQPIACIEHEKLEFAVLRKQRLHLVHVNEDDGAIHERLISPLDVFTRQGAEWLLFHDVQSGESCTVRLDKIRSFLPA